ncbi:MAG: hypothetical protein GWO05_01855 [Gammaproteobacteria bacterium]|nr:hypothetical protein [Gammaproteobacteria bacterium]
MCDYSLEHYRSRPAQTGERYELTQFPSGSKGLASPGDCTTAVCVPYETRLRLHAIPEDLQQCLEVRETEEATFVQFDTGRYRDAVKFDNGRIVSLQELTPGITASIAQSLERPLRETTELEIERVS